CQVGGSDSSAANLFLGGVFIGFAGGSNDVVQGNHFVNGGGVTINFSSGNTLLGNTFTGPAGTVRGGLSGHDNLIQSNTFTINAIGFGAGTIIRADSADHNRIEFNTLTGGQFGIHFESGDDAYNLVRGNTISNTIVAVGVESGAVGNEITQNSIYHNDFGIDF